MSVSWRTLQSLARSIVWTPGYQLCSRFQPSRAQLTDSIMRAASSGTLFSRRQPARRCRHPGRGRTGHAGREQHGVRIGHLPHGDRPRSAITEVTDDWDGDLRPVGAGFDIGIDERP